MITCFLQGGLGNQIFQILAAINLSIENNDEVCFNFNQCYTPLQGKRAINYKETIFRNLCHSDDIKISNVYHEPGFSYNNIPYTPNLQIHGYFQSEKYIKTIKNNLKDYIYLDEDSVKKPIENLTSVHVRRGDYVGLQQVHKLCDIEYYKEAMEIIGGNFIFFSDDMEWVKENFEGKNILYSQYNDELLDLTLMTLCDNNIIANSSFSWWGAFLNKNKNKKIIAPKKWFGINGPQDTQDIIPENWIKL